MKKLWQREPAVILGLLTAALNLAIGFGLPISSEQVALLNAFAVAAVAFAIRSQVTPV